jgi:hypothetical protein
MSRAEKLGVLMLGGAASWLVLIMGVKLVLHAV